MIYWLDDDGDFEYLRDWVNEGLSKHSRSFESFTFAARIYDESGAGIVFVMTMFPKPAMLTALETFHYMATTFYYAAIELCNMVFAAPSLRHFVWDLDLDTYWTTPREPDSDPMLNEEKLVLLKQAIKLEMQQISITVSLDPSPLEATLDLVSDVSKAT